MDDTVIVVLKNQAQIVCNLKEVYEGSEENKKGVCLLMIHPYVLKIIGDGEEENIQIRFEKWCPYSPDTEFKIPYDSVMAIGSCDPTLNQAYLSKISSLTTTSENEIDE